MCFKVHAQDAAIYFGELCRVMLMGVTAQLRADSRLKPGCYGIQARDEEDVVRELFQVPMQSTAGNTATT